MNERLKFRAYVEDVCFYGDVKKSFLIYGVAVFGGCQVGHYGEDIERQLKLQGFSEDEIEQFENDWCSNECDDWFNFDADYVEQCTGLKDKKGKLIYENDFVLLNGEIWQVIWSEEDCAFFLSSLKEKYHQPIYPDLYNHAENFEVVGNVHETPELLKGE